MVCRHALVKAESEGVPSAPTISPGEGRRNDSGVALVITLLLLFLMSVIGLAAVLSAGSDLLINGYYSNFRGSFYAADSGLNIARQAMYNQLNSSFATSFTTFQSPPPSGVTGLDATVTTYVRTNYGGGGACPINPSSYSTATTCYLNAGTGSNSWAESFNIVPANTQVSLAPGSPTAIFSGTTITGYNYIYNYTLSVVGSATGSEKSTINESGSFTINVSGTPSTYSQSFAIYGAFITNYPACLGALVPGTMTGPMFTNGEWGFEPGGSYIFTDAVGQHDANASYFVNGNCYTSPSSSYTKNGTTIAPQFQSGFNRSQATIPQPANSYSQKWAAIDGIGTGEANANPTNADMNAKLKDLTGAAYPSSGASSGVYFNYDSSTTPPTLKGGGVYVEGNASMVVSTSGSSGQVFTIKQGGTTTTMTVDPVANTTTVVSGATTLTLSGVPTNSSVTPPQQGTMAYVNGTITSLSGPGEGVGAIQDGAAVTISAANDINITGDVRYKTEPVTMTQNQIPSTPVDTLIPGNDKGQDLGIFTANGNIIMSSSYADKNLQVDGSQAVIGSNCASSSCGFLVNGCINTFNNVGGQIQTNIFGACLNTQNTYYDRRYNTKSGFAPPWFPSTTVVNTGASATALIITPQRTQWVANSGQ